MRLKRLLRLLALSGITLTTFLVAVCGFAQTASVAQMQALAQSMAANQQHLRVYQWTEIRKVTIDGNDGPKIAFRCSYGTDGRLIHDRLNGPAPQQFDFNTELMALFDQVGDHSDRDYIKKANALAESYFPLNAEHMLSQVQGGTVTATVDSGSGFVNLTFHSYALPGDQMLVAYDPQAMRVVNVMVNTYVGEQKPTNSLTVMANYDTLSDGTNHLGKLVLQPDAKHIVVTTRNENYQPLVR